MGASISKDHDPKQYQSLKDAEAAVLKHYGATEDVVTECWIDMNSNGHNDNDNDNNNNNINKHNKLRCLKVGREDGRRAVVVIHGGGGMASEWAPLFCKLKEATNDDKNHDDFQFWFLERPGHGLSDPFDYWTVGNNLVQYHADWVEAVRRSAIGVDKMDVVSNSMGGWVTYCYASLYPQHVRSFTWVGAPAWYKGMVIPFDFKLMGGSWIGTQLMSWPPPKGVPQKLLLETFQQTQDAVPECFVGLYHAMMSLRNTSLSWNSLLRVTLIHAKEIEYDLEELDIFANRFPCQLIVGCDEPFLSEEKQKVIESKFGRPAMVVGKGHLPWLEDPRGVAKAIVTALNISTN